GVSIGNETIYMICGGIQRGQAPFVSLRGVVPRRGTQSKVSPSWAPFCLLFRRGKSRPGPGGGAPKKESRASRSGKLSKQRFGRRRPPLLREIEILRLEPHGQYIRELPFQLGGHGLLGGGHPDGQAAEAAELLHVGDGLQHGAGDGLVGQIRVVDDGGEGQASR